MSNPRAIHHANQLIWGWMRKHYKDLFSDHAPLEPALRPTHARLEALLYEDRELYDFTEMRSRGMSLKEMDRTSIFGGRLMLRGHHSARAQRLNHRAIRAIADTLPEQIRAQISQETLHALTTLPRRKQERQRFPCPLCGGTLCYLCRDHDGTVSYNIMRLWKKGRFKPPRTP